MFHPRDVLNPPLSPADNANAWRLFDYRTKEFDKVANGVLLLTRRLKESLPTANGNELSDPILGMGQLTSLAIMAHIRTQYGTLTSEDYKHLYIQLNQKLDSATSFSGFAADQRFIFQHLAAQGQPVPELQKCDFLRTLRTGTAHLLPIHNAIDLYLTDHPLIATQTFASLVAHTSLHALNFTQVTADMGYTAAAIQLATPSQPVSHDLLYHPSFITALATAVAAAAAKTPVSRFPRSRKACRGERPPAPSLPLSPVRPYCYVHGYDGHSSADCYKMRYGLAAKDFTDAARLVTTHTFVSGGSVTRL